MFCATQLVLNSYLSKSFKLNALPHSATARGRVWHLLAVRQHRCSLMASQSHPIQTEAPSTLLFLQVLQRLVGQRYLWKQQFWRPAITESYHKSLRIDLGKLDPRYQ